MRSEGPAPRNGRPVPPHRELNALALTDAELLGLLLAGGRGGRDQEGSMRLAHELLAEWGGLAALSGESPSMLTHRGLHRTQTAVLTAAAELACRLARQRVPDRQPLSRPDELARFLTLRYQRRDQEVMGALFLDLRHGYIGDREIYRGTLHRVAVEPREIFKQCLLCGAAGVVIFHNHPTGDVTPSAEDLQFTRRMADAGAVLGIELVDHLILASTGRWLSLKSRGAW